MSGGDDLPSWLRFAPKPPKEEKAPTEGEALTTFNSIKSGAPVRADDREFQKWYSTTLSNIRSNIREHTTDTSRSSSSRMSEHMNPAQNQSSGSSSAGYIGRTLIKQRLSSSTPKDPVRTSASGGSSGGGAGLFQSSKRAKMTKKETNIALYLALDMSEHLVFLAEHGVTKGTMGKNEGAAISLTPPGGRLAIKPRHLFDLVSAGDDLNAVNWVSPLFPNLLFVILMCICCSLKGA